MSDETALSRTRIAGERCPASAARARSYRAAWLLLCSSCACNAESGGSDPVTTVQLRPPPATIVAPFDQQPAAEDSSARRPVEAAPEHLEPRLLAPGANDEFDAATLADVKGALSAVEEAAFAPLVQGDKRVTPKSCRSWRELRARGFAPKSALAARLDGGALARCGALEFLARAKPSRVGHVRNALLGAGPNSLPAIVASATSRLALQARNVAVSKGLTLGQFLPGARTGKSELRGRVLIDEPASATSVIVNAEAWGDINSDEIEDLLLSVLNSDDDVSYFDLRLIEVTRTSPDAPLTVLAVSE
ncbi:MAG: hypothetical protein ABI895_19765 [Deltaproteobacteria bacterium]